MKPNKLMRKAISKAKERVMLEVEIARKNKCYACNGTGIYDITGSPPCGACNGTGKVK